jgi:hypothetical protein
MKTAEFMTMEEYLECSKWKPDAEYVDGVIEERPAVCPERNWRWTGKPRDGGWTDTLNAYAVMGAAAGLATKAFQFPDESSG